MFHYNILSTDQDKVFINFVDHGGVGMILFPDFSVVRFTFNLNSFIPTLVSLFARLPSKRWRKHWPQCTKKGVIKSWPSIWRHANLDRCLRSSFRTILWVRLKNLTERDFQCFYTHTHIQGNNDFTFSIIILVYAVTAANESESSWGKK